MTVTVCATAEVVIELTVEFVVEESVVIVEELTEVLVELTVEDTVELVEFIEVEITLVMLAVNVVCETWLCVVEFMDADVVEVGLVAVEEVVELGAAR